MFSSLKDKVSLDSEVGKKISDSVASAIEEHKPQIIEFVSANMGRIPVQELQSDENIAKLARFLYPLLPGLLRMIVKEDAFANFVVEHKSIIADKIIPLMAKQS